MRPGQSAFTRTSVRASWQELVWAIEFTLERDFRQSLMSSVANTNTHAALLALSVARVSACVAKENKVTYNV